jgi:hypothetical protein
VVTPRTRTIRWLLVWLGLALGLQPTGGPARAGERLLLALPALDPVPPELAMPSLELWVESLLLELKDPSVRVSGMHPAGLSSPAEAEREARRRGSELAAQAVVWARLLPPGSGCSAPRRVRLVLMEPASGESLQRDLCPDGSPGQPISPEALARAMALAAVHALETGELPGFPAAVESRPPAKRCVCPEPVCPSCPEPVCPACPQPPPPDRGRLRLYAGALFSSHPTWEAASLGPDLRLGVVALDWLEAGLGVEVLQGRRIRLAPVEALFTSLPLQIWAAGLWGGDTWQAGVSLGLQVTWTRMDALLPELGRTASVERWNPALVGRLLGRWWSPWNFAIQLEIGTSVHLRTQRYVYSGGGSVENVLGLQTASLEICLLLVLPLW